MPTVFVETKIEYSVGTKWPGVKEDERMEMIQDVMDNPRGQAFVMTFFGPDSDDWESQVNASHMQVTPKNFAPMDSWKFELDEKTKELHVEFDGVIKLPITDETSDALKSWPTDKPVQLWISRINWWDNVVPYPVPLGFTCKVSKSKPKGVSF